MKAKNTTKNVKEPVRIRVKALAHGNYSIYLDTYHRGVRKYEFLRLYLRPEHNKADREANALTMQMANAIKAKRTLEMSCDRLGLKYGLYAKPKLEEYLGQYKTICQKSHRGKSYVNAFNSMVLHLRNFLGQRMAKLLMCDIDKTLCRSFCNYLNSAVLSTGKPLAQASAYHYFGVFKGMLSEAVKEGILTVNPVEQLKKGEQPQRQDKLKEHLGTDDLVRLSATPCDREEVKQAFMFCCFTGLRYSDVSRLKWTDIRKEGNDWRLSIVMQKTLQPLLCKLSEAAMRWLPPLQCDDSLVFKLPALSTIERTLQRWVTAAGINRHVTFHTARHSYATMALTAGADIYTISKLLGHRNIRTTTVYAAVVDARRDAATDSVSDLFQLQLTKSGSRSATDSKK